MAYTRRNTTDGVTVMNKDLYDNLQDGIEERGVTPEMFGAVGDGVHDDTEAFKKLLRSNRLITLDSNKRYLITGTLNLADLNYFIIKGNNSTIEFTSDFLFEICNCSNFTIESLTLMCNGHGGFNFTTRTGEDRTGKTLIKNISFFNCSLGFQIDSPCGYNYFENIYFHKMPDSSVGFSIGQYLDESFVVYPNYIYLNKVTFDGEMTGSNKVGVKLYYGVYIYISECDFCNIINGFGIDICNSEFIHTISIHHNSFFNNVCSIGIHNSGGLDGLCIEGNNFHLIDSDVVLIKESSTYQMNALLFCNNSVIGSSTSSVWLNLNKLSSFKGLGNTFDSNLTPVYKHCIINCLKGNITIDSPTQQFLDFTNSTPASLNCGGKYLMKEFRWGVFSQKEFKFNYQYDNQGDLILTITPINNTGYMRCFAIPVMA